MSFAAMMVHLDLERDCEQRVQLALDLADRFQAALIGVAGLALRPVFAAGAVAVYGEPSEQDCRAVTARFDEMGRKFRTQGQHLKQIEWRTSLELPSDLVAREARAADLVIVGPRHTSGPLHDLVEPGAILLRAGRPILVVPDTTTPLRLRRVVVACRDTRECRRAVCDALPLLGQAKEVLLVEIGEETSKSRRRKVSRISGAISCATASSLPMKSGGGRVDRLQTNCWSWSVPRGQTWSWPAAMDTAAWGNGSSAGSRMSVCCMLSH